MSTFRYRFSIDDENSDCFLEFFRTLVKNGADINQKLRDGSTHLSKASSEGNIGIVRFLLENGAVEKELKREAVAAASGNGRLEIVKLLCSSGVSCVGTTCQAAIVQACREGHLNVVEFLTDMGADLNSFYKGRGLIYRLFDSKYSFVHKYLIDKGVDLNVVSAEGKTVMDEILSYKPECPSFEMYASAGADALKAIRNERYLPHIEKCFYDTILHKHVYERNDDALKTVLEEDTGVVAVNCINCINCVSCVNCISCINCMGIKGEWTALHLAAFMNRLVSAEILVEKGADIFEITRDGKGLNALQIACNRGHFDIVSFFLIVLKKQKEGDQRKKKGATV